MKRILWCALGCALALVSGLAPAGAAEVREFAVRGGSGASAYQGTARVSPAGSVGEEALFLNVEWTFGTYVIRGYGVVANDDPSTLTVSFVAPAGLGVGRYRIQPDGGLVGSLVGEKGIFVQEVWTATEGGGPLKPGTLSNR